ncbi:coiled-coil domain-containing protein 167 [Electrophorus electricus]|uniref:Coiled-coil domain-containing protein 167 n=1 Tax=Electrophorus electricus TaxID=8005 RepID=A0A4W4G6B1_ELEEL|nr:coiled-coil domain-containing protein 167 [Electrophorus electricus]
MTKSRNMKREKISVANEIDLVEERLLLCRGTLGRAEFRFRREQLSDEDRQALEDEMTIINERIEKYEEDLTVLRRENRRNMMLSVALLTVSALLYYVFVY